MRNLLIFILFAVVMALSPLPSRADEALANDKEPLFKLTYQQAEEAVSQALADKGAGLKVGAMINGRSNDALFSHSAPLRVEIRGLQFDKPSGHWSGNLLAVADGEVITAVPAAGRFDELAEIPMLKRTLRNGELIAAKDIEIRDIPVGQTRSDTITDMDSLIGKSPSHSISAFRPIRQHEIGAPPLVKKNNIVQMHYKSPGMEITTTGQAMEDGAKGSVISVRNMASKRVVQAVVDDAGSVSIAAPEASRAETPAIGDLYARN